MGFSYTPDQQKVIDLHKRNILVSAAAGSGKTAVLVERIIRMVCNEEQPVDIDRLLIVTFTKAAAAEMRERISAGIAGALLEHPESEHIARQATLLHNAQITTIDSFCLYILRNHFNEIGLDPAFRIADEGEIKLLSADVMDGLMEDYFTERSADFTEMVEFFYPSGKEKALEEHVRELFTVASSNPWPRQWLLARKEDYNISTVEELEAAPFARLLVEHLQKISRDIHREYTMLLRLCEEPDGPYMYGELVEEECKMVEKLLSCQSLTQFALAFDSIRFGRLSSKKDDAINGDKRQAAKDKRDALKKLIAGIQSKYFVLPLETVVTHMQKSAPAVRQLVDVTVEYYDRFLAAKQEKKLVDFADMEHYALKILLKREGEEILPSNVAMEYQEYFHEILIDEYQDSNLVQEYLLGAISGEKIGKYNRFMVGDVKQSIYKFRLARPDLFLDKQRSYTHEDSLTQRIDLSRNFRSRREVIDTVNGIFEGLMDEEKGGILYDAGAALYVGAAYEEAPGMESELLLVEEESELLQLSGKELEAQMIAQRIRELQRELLVTDKGTGQLRPVRYKDMVILLRTNSGWDEEFKKVLEKEGIPVYITSKTGYFSALEVQELLSFLRVLDNPTQDIPLYGVLKSLFGGFTEEEIALVRCKDKKCSLWENVGFYAEQGEDVLLKERCGHFRQQVEKYRGYSIYMPIRQLLEALVDEYQYLAYVSSMPGGSKRKANVEMLFTKASDFESTSYFGLFHFVRYIEKLEKYDVDFGEADVLDENADVVRIMSIHKSKGLEFPVTFVAGLGKRFNMQDAGSSFLLDADLGIGTDYVNHKERYKVKNLRRMALSEKLREENLAEELRVLYVALTRPKEKLIMTACMKNAEAQWEKHRERREKRLSYLEFMNASGYLDFILPVLPTEQVKVNVLTEENLVAEQAREQMTLEEKRYLLEQAKEWVSQELFAELRERFTYRYAHENLSQLHTKTSVSELKMAAMAEKDEAAYEAFGHDEERKEFVPGFIEATEEHISATTRGNAFHKAMEILDFDKVLGQGADIKVLLEEQVRAGKLSEEYFRALNIKKLRGFFNTSLAREMWEASTENKLFREQPFVYSIAANRLKEEFPSTEKVLIQGIIDAFYIREGKIILVDYKTDRVETGKQLWERYEAQMSYYKEALENLLQLPVEKAVLYSFSLESCEEQLYSS